MLLDALTAAVTHDLRPRKGTSGTGRCEFEKVEASAGFEPAVEVLQTAEGSSPGFADVHCVSGSEL